MGTAESSFFQFRQRLSICPWWAGGHSKDRVPARFKIPRYVSLNDYILVNESHFVFT